MLNSILWRVNKLAFRHSCKFTTMSLLPSLKKLTTGEIRKAYAAFSIQIACTIDKQCILGSRHLYNSLRHLSQGGQHTNKHIKGHRRQNPFRKSYFFSSIFYPLNSILTPRGGFDIYYQGFGHSIGIATNVFIGVNHSMTLKTIIFCLLNLYF